MIFEKVQNILAEQLGVPAEDIQLSTNIIDDLGADSLDVVELIMAIEEEYDLEIADEDAAELTTVAKIVDYIEANA